MAVDGANPRRGSASIPDDGGAWRHPHLEKHIELGLQVADSSQAINKLSPLAFEALISAHEIAEEQALFDFTQDPANIHKLAELGKRPMRCGNISKVIRTVALLVVVPAELEPIERKFNFQRNPELERRFCGQAAKITSGMVQSPQGGETYQLHIIAFGTSPEFNNRYNSGPAQAGSVAALVADIIRPDLAISFGTSGGFLRDWHLLPGQERDESDETHGREDLEITNTVMVDAAFNIDRFRSSSASSFQWGVWGGPTIRVSDKLITDCNLRRGNCGSQYSYKVNEIGRQIIRAPELDIVVTDMETASEAQVFRLAEVNFMAFKVVSNGVYPNDPAKQEQEYVVWQDRASEEASKALFRILDYIRGKSIADLTGADPSTGVGSAHEEPSCAERCFSLGLWGTSPMVGPKK